MSEEYYYPGLGVLGSWMNHNGPDSRFGGNDIIHRNFYRAIWKYEKRFGRYPPRSLWPVILEQVEQKLEE